MIDFDPCPQARWSTTSCGPAASPTAGFSRRWGRCRASASFRRAGATLAYIDEHMPWAPAGVRCRRRRRSPGWSSWPKSRHADSVLDVGCGTGYSDCRARRARGRVVGVEQDAALAARARDQPCVRSASATPRWCGGRSTAAALAGGAIRRGDHRGRGRCGTDGAVAGICGITAGWWRCRHRDDGGGACVRQERAATIDAAAEFNAGTAGLLGGGAAREEFVF